MTSAIPTHRTTYGLYILMHRSGYSFSLATLRPQTALETRGAWINPDTTVRQTTEVVLDPPSNLLWQLGSAMMGSTCDGSILTVNPFGRPHFITRLNFQTSGCILFPMTIHIEPSKTNTLAACLGFQGVSGTSCQCTPSAEYHTSFRLPTPLV